MLNFTKSLTNIEILINFVILDSLNQLQTPIFQLPQTFKTLILIISKKFNFILIEKKKSEEKSIKIPKVLKNVGMIKKYLNINFVKNPNKKFENRKFFVKDMKKNYERSNILSLSNRRDKNSIFKWRRVMKLRNSKKFKF